MSATNRSTWPFWLTGAVIVVALTVFYFTPDMKTASDIGAYLSGVAAIVAFVWLIAAYLQQGQNLELQRHELTLQRRTLEAQRIELSKLSKYAAMDQISRILEKFDEAIKGQQGTLIQGANDLPQAFLRGMTYWNKILESTSNGEKVDAFQKWFAIESSCREFLTRFVSALEVYKEVSDVSIDLTEVDAAKLIISQYNEIIKIPFIRSFSGAAYQTAMQLYLFDPGLKKMQLAGFKALNQQLPGAIKEEAIQKLEEQVRALDS